MSDTMQGHVVRRVSEFGPQECEFLRNTVSAAVSRDMAVGYCSRS